MIRIIASSSARKEDSEMLWDGVKKGHILVSAMVWIGMMASGLGMVSPTMAQTEGTIVDHWANVQAPPPVELKPVTVNVRETAFLILDIEKRTCNAERRPRCVASVPKIQGFLDRVRAKGMPVVYSLTGRGTPADIWPQVAPRTGEPIVKSSVDKFFQTDLERILQDKAIKTLIIVGTTAEGAVLHTATAAAMRGFQVIVPVDGVSAGTMYAEQYTAWHLVNAPGSRRRTTLTRFDMIEF
jgi:nicotinamidase-related amidase